MLLFVLLTDDEASRRYQIPAAQYETEIKLEL